MQSSHCHVFNRNYTRIERHLNIFMQKSLFDKYLKIITFTPQQLAIIKLADIMGYSLLLLHHVRGPSPATRSPNWYTWAWHAFCTARSCCALVVDRHSFAFPSFHQPRDLLFLHFSAVTFAQHVRCLFEGRGGGGGTTTNHDVRMFWSIRMGLQYEPVAVYSYLLALGKNANKHLQDEPSPNHVHDE